MAWPIKKIPAHILKTNETVMNLEKSFVFFLHHVITGLKQSSAAIWTELVLHKI